MTNEFQLIGEKIEREWERRGSDVEAFADVAGQAMIESELLHRHSTDDIIDLIVSSPSIPPQYYRDFGQPPINLFLGNGFLIEALFWVDATTSIHQHAFSGAFGVLAGSSLHSEYRFHRRECLSREVMLGSLEYLSSELLTTGDVRTIHPGDSFIHSLFHLDRPSVSVVIRTKAREELMPQYQYLKPWLAIDPFHKPQPEMTQLRLLDTLRRTDQDLFWKTAKTIAGDCSKWMLYKVLAIAYHKYHTSSNWEELWRDCSAHHGPVVDDFVASLEEQSREIRIIARRESIHDPVYRFFLALLLNVPNSGTIRALVSSRFPDCDPISLIADWISELSRARLLGAEFNTLSLELLKSAIRGHSYEHARSTLHDSHSDSPNLADEPTMRAVWDGLVSEPVLRPLFL